MSKEFLHSTAQSLFVSHDQSNWAITEDGLICAPIGFYRFVEELNKEKNESSKTVVFAFDEDDLDLIQSLEDPSRKILSKPAYIVEPITATEAETLAALQRKMEDHQAKWLLFVWGYGNLYYTDRREEKQGEFFSNNFLPIASFLNMTPKEF